MTNKVLFSVSFLVLGACASTPIEEPSPVPTPTPVAAPAPAPTPVDTPWPIPKSEEPEEAILSSITLPDTIQQCENAEEENRTCVTVLYGTNRIPSDCTLDAINLGMCKTGIDVKPNAEDTEKLYTDMGDVYGIAPDPRCEPIQVIGNDTITPPSRVCHLGQVTVSVPSERRSGKVYNAEPGQVFSNPRNASKKFWIANFNEFTNDPETEFKELVSEFMTEDDTSKNHAIVYIHGFNVKYRNAAFRSAQLKFDMGFKGPVMFYSWPANGSTLDYLNDQIDGDLSVEDLVDFLELANEAVSASRPDAKLHIIAHSMGTRVTSQALRKFVDRPNPPSLGKIIFAAGDVDTKLFRKWMDPVIPHIDNLTIYSSDKDGAVQVASILRSLASATKKIAAEAKTRLGFFDKKNKRPPYVWDKTSDDKNKIETIDISEVTKKSFWGWLNFTNYFINNHSKYAEHFHVTDDILRSICDDMNLSPDERSFYISKVNSHWRVNKQRNYDISNKRQGCKSSILHLKK